MLDRWKYKISLAVAIIVAFIAAHNVTLLPTRADRLAAAAILGPIAASIIDARPATYEEEIEIIFAVQEAVLRAAPKDEGIPLGSPREPGDLYEAGSGLCYDRSRAIEKLLRLAGFETRHIAVYSISGGGTALGALLTPRSPSHAVSEVLTRRGWVLVDSNRRWIGLSADDGPVSIAQVIRNNGALVQSSRVSEQIDPIFKSSFTFLYGLYSRHGRFFSPYTPIPDVNWLELADNIAPA